MLRCISIHKPLDHVAKRLFDPPLLVLIGNKHDALATISMNLRLQLLKLLQILRGKTGHQPLNRRFHVLTSLQWLIVPI